MSLLKGVAMGSRVAATGVLLLAMAVSGCAADGPRRPDPAVSSSDTELPNPTAGRTGAVEGSAATSCVEEYTPETLRNRAFAFDGVVIGIGDSVSDTAAGVELNLPGVTFRVHRWFSGGEARTFTVDLQAPRESFGVGSRLLVSGESRWGDPDLADAIAWGCGFTRYFDARTADAWDRAF
jgi:hypothetical protein